MFCFISGVCGSDYFLKYILFKNISKYFFKKINFDISTSKQYENTKKLIWSKNQIYFLKKIFLKPKNKLTIYHQRGLKHEKFGLKIIIIAINCVPHMNASYKKVTGRSYQ